MRITVKNLKRLIKEAVVQESIFYAATYDEESQAFHAFFQGSEQECRVKAKKMARLLGTPFEDESPDPNELVYDDGNVHGMCRALPADDERLHVEGTLMIATVTPTTHNAYQEESQEQNVSVMWPAGGDYEPEPDDPGWVPVKPTQFVAGDTVILAMAVYNNPGGMIVVDQDITRREYWQSNTYGS
jgi:hypothetical protein